MSAGRIEDWIDSDHTESCESTSGDESHKSPGFPRSSQIDDWLHPSHQEVKTSWGSSDEIGSELSRWFISNPQLQQSFSNAISEIKSRYDNIQLNAFVDRDYDDPSQETPVLETRADISSADEWIEFKTEIRKLVREAEVGDEMIFTRVERL